VTIVQTNLQDVVAGLANHLRSIDIRAVLCQEKELQNVMTVIRISGRSIEEIEQRQTKLIERFGKGDYGRFIVKYEAHPFSDWNDIRQQFENGVIPIRGAGRIPNRISAGSFLGHVQRSGRPVLSWTGVPAPAFYAGHNVDPLSVNRQASLTRDVRAGFGLGSVQQAIEAYLELRDSHQDGSNLRFSVDMPALITGATATGTQISVDIESDLSFRDFRLNVNLYDDSGVHLEESRRPGFITVREDSHRRSLNAIAQFSDLRDTQIVGLTLTSDTLADIDELPLRVHDLFVPQEQNILLASLRQFWDMGRFYETVSRPGAVKPHRLPIEPQDIFQRNVARVLTLCGFQAIDLERDDKIRDAATRIQRGTADILAYHSHLKTLLVAGCTIGVPKSEDYEELLHVREILRPPPLSRITIICALFALTEAESPHRADYASQGLRVLNSRDIVRAIELIESGREREVIDNLVSPFGHSLA